MSDVGSFIDPAFEPTDEDLIGISTRAFAHLRKAQEDATRKLRLDIAAARRTALERLRERKSSAGTGS